jgi:hypothetical protein
MPAMPRKVRSILSATVLAGALLAATPLAAPAQAESAAGRDKPLQHSTRGVNAAIIGLGALWLLLMVRRIQSVAALRHARAGH